MEELWETCIGFYTLEKMRFMKNTVLHKIAMLLSLKPLYALDPNYKNEIPAIPCTRHLECSSNAESI